MKTICMYLPQYHSIPENDEWWGNGYTEWTAVKKAKPLYNGHNQPRVPLNNNYYDLEKDGVETWKWQADLAKEFDIYGFCIYHYWFCGKMLLQKPMEILLENKNINIKFCICWANETWSRRWYDTKPEVLQLQEYGDEEDWRNHFNYLLPFFCDDRYIKIDNKPVVNIYRSYNIDCLGEMIECWNKLAVQNGFNGVYIVSCKAAGKQETRKDLVDAYYIFEPGFSTKNEMSFYDNAVYYLPIISRKIINKILRKKVLLERKVNVSWVYKKISNRKYIMNDNIFPGTFPGWDNTPRCGMEGTAYINSDSKLFRKNLLHIKEKIQHKQLDFVYVNAWNEWGEGAYLEPDIENKYDYLKAISDVVSEI